MRAWACKIVEERAAVSLTAEILPWITGIRPKKIPFPVGRGGYVTVERIGTTALKVLEKTLPFSLLSSGKPVQRNELPNFLSLDYSRDPAEVVVFVESLYYPMPFPASN